MENKIETSIDIESIEKKELENIKLSNDTKIELPNIIFNNSKVKLFSITSWLIDTCNEKCNVYQILLLFITLSYICIILDLIIDIVVLSMLFLIFGFILCLLGNTNFFINSLKLL